LLTTVPEGAMSQKNIQMYPYLNDHKSPNFSTLPLVKASPGFSESMLKGPEQVIM